MRPFDNSEMKDSSPLHEDEAVDVYENDDIIDRFMDDIDEGTMCEGSRQSQQDFNYNATGGRGIVSSKLSFNQPVAIS